MGPNTVLHGALPKAATVLHDSLPKAARPLSLPTTISSSIYTMIFQPILPQGPASSVELIISMVNASALVLQSLNNSRYQECWICFSPRPPFYEGMLTFENLTFTNETPSLRWHSVNHEGLTLSQVSGKGLCIRGPELLLFPRTLTANVQPNCHH